MTVNVADAHVEDLRIRDPEHRREVRRDVLVLTTGVALVLLTIWVPVHGDDQITGALLILGLVAYVAGLWAMTTGSRASHWSLAILGVALLLTPMVMAFPAGTTVAAVIAVAAGALIAGVGLVGLARHPGRPAHRR